MRKLDVHVVMADGSEYKTTSRTADYMAYDLEQKRRGWGPMAEAPSTWEAFIAWRALLRDKAISMPFDLFVDQVDIIDARAQEADADTFPQAAPDGSSSS